jgi:hypothetical protein
MRFIACAEQKRENRKTPTTANDTSITTQATNLVSPSLDELIVLS